MSSDKELQIKELSAEKIELKSTLFDTNIVSKETPLPKEFEFEPPLRLLPGGTPQYNILLSRPSVKISGVSYKIVVDRAPTHSIVSAPSVVHVHHESRSFYSSDDYGDPDIGIFVDPSVASFGSALLSGGQEMTMDPAELVALMDAVNASKGRKDLPSSDYFSDPTAM